MLNKCCHLLAAACLALPTLVQAARPLQTDDGGVLDPGACEIVGFAQQVREQGQRSNEAALEGACGLGWNSQLGLGLARARDAGGHVSGLSLAGKTGLWQAGAGGAALALSWWLDSAKAPAHSWRHVGTGVNLLATAPLGAGHQLHGNLGHSRDHVTHRQSTTWSLAIEHGGLGQHKAWAPMAELFGDDREPPWWNLGLRVTVVADKAWLDLSWGRQISAAKPALVTLGLKLGF